MIAPPPLDCRREVPPLFIGQSCYAVLAVANPLDLVKPPSGTTSKASKFEQKLEARSCSTRATTLDQVERPSGGFCSASELKCRYSTARTSLTRASLVEWLKMPYFGSCFSLLSWLCSSRPSSLKPLELSEQRMHQKYLICVWVDEFYLKCNKTTKHQTKRKILNKISIAVSNANITEPNNGDKIWIKCS